MTDAETVARSLSKAQVRAMLWLPADGAWKDHRRGPSGNDGVSRTALECLRERIVGKPEREVAQIFRLVQFSFNTGALEAKQVWRNSEYRLTPLGLAVKASLEGASNGK